MQDLARVGVALGRRLGGLRRRQKREHAARDVGRQPQDLERGDDPVAAERCAEPGDARVGIRPVRRLRDHHLEIRHRAGDPLVQLRAGGAHAAARQLAARDRTGQRRTAAIVVELGAVAAVVAAQLHVDRRGAARRQPQVKTRLAAMQIVGHRIEADPRAALDAIEPFVAQGHPPPLDNRLVAGAAALALRAAHLEDVGVVGVEAERELDVDGGRREAGDAQALVAAAPPQELRAEHVQRPARQHELPRLVLEVGRGEIDGQEIVLLLHRRRQQQRPPPADAQLQPRQEAGAVVVDALLAQADRLDVAEAVEHRERLVVLEHARAIVGTRRRRLDVVLLVEADDLVVRRRPECRHGGYSIPTPVSPPSLSTACPPSASASASIAASPNAVRPRPLRRRAVSIIAS